MENRRVPTSLTLIALLQVIAVLVLPPSLLRGIGVPIAVALAVVFGLLGFSLLRLRDWARVATVFIQGFNIIVRLLILLSNVVPKGAEGQVDMGLLVTSLVSMFLSACVLYLIEKPDIELIMQR
jgi:membrane associated rhomboid family serine protease